MRTFLFWSHTRVSFERNVASKNGDTGAAFLKTSLATLGEVPRHWPTVNKMVECTLRFKGNNQKGVHPVLFSQKRVHYSLEIK